MTVYDPPELLLADQAEIKTILVDSLKLGFLSVFVGAGVPMSTASKSSGAATSPKPPFPSWAELVKECCIKTGTAFDDSKAHNNDYLQRAAENAEGACNTKSLDFLEIVEKALYATCPAYDAKLLKLDLLIALGSLVMTSTRGSASVVVNYNFDDLLEWYLLMHGFTVTVVSDLPTLTQKADVVIYHPHGFLPKTHKLIEHRSKSIVFTKRSYQRAFKDPAPWNEFQRFRLGCNLCLFVGLSGDDPHIEYLYSTVHDDLKGKRILGVLVLLDTPENRERQEQCKNRGLLHYYIPEYEALPDFILEICRLAAGA